MVHGKRLQASTCNCLTCQQASQVRRQQVISSLCEVIGHDVQRHARAIDLCRSGWALVSRVGELNLLHKFFGKSFVFGFGDRFIERKQ
mmetsp:Transcript_53143/g.98301  ORF Transcript_53143/g.98301 Transcript_53143/m.98301 type:complete len:88 (+) Transcript_53143:112-375(+)